MRSTQVVIVGGVPSGLLLSQLLSRSGIDSIVLERQSRADVQARIRAGLLEWTTVSLPERFASRLVQGPSLEKSTAPLRSFVVEPMRFGQLFLVGEAAHIVPPTGAKGLNLAAADAGVLARGLVEFYRSSNSTLLDEYSARALDRVWKATRFSWWLTMLMHRFPHDSFAHQLQIAELKYPAQPQAASRAVAENYVGLPAAA